jgi:hypothetical protein
LLGLLCLNGLRLIGFHDAIVDYWLNGNLRLIIDGRNNWDNWNDRLDELRGVVVDVGSVE